MKVKFLFAISIFLLLIGLTKSADNINALVNIAVADISFVSNDLFNTNLDNNNLNDLRQANGNSVLIDGKWLIIGKIINLKLVLECYNIESGIVLNSQHTDTNANYQSHWNYYSSITNDFEISNTWTYINSQGEIFYPLVQKSGLNYYAVSRFIKFNSTLGTFEENSSFNSFNYKLLTSLSRELVSNPANIIQQIQIPIKCTTVNLSSSSVPIVMISIRIKYTSTLNTNGYNYYEGIITSFQAGLSEMNASFLSNNYLKYIEKSMSYSSEFPGTVPAFRGDFTDQLYGNTPFGLSSSILYIFCFNDKFFYSKYNFSLLIFETNQVSLSGNEKFLSIRQDINNWNGEDYIITCAIIEDISMLTYKLTVIVTKISDNTKTQQSFTNPIGTYIYVNSCKSIGQWIFICTEGTFNNNYNYCYSIYLNDPNPSSISNNTSTVLFSKIDVGNSSKKIWYVLDFFFIENIKYFEVSMYLNMYEVKNGAAVDKWKLKKITIISGSSDPTLNGKSFIAVNKKKSDNTPILVLQCYYNQFLDGFSSPFCQECSGSLKVKNNTCQASCTTNRPGYCEEDVRYNYRPNYFYGMKHLDKSTLCNSPNVYLNGICKDCFSNLSLKTQENMCVDSCFLNDYVSHCTNSNLCIDGSKHTNNSICYNCRYDVIKFYPNNNTCLSTCPNNLSSTNNRCEECLSPNRVDENGVCGFGPCLNSVSKLLKTTINSIDYFYCGICPQLYENFLCVSNCLSGNINNGNGDCVSCNLIDSNFPVELNNLTCIADLTCPDGYTQNTNSTNSYAKYCYNCTSNGLIEENGVCVTKCTIDGNYNSNAKCKICPDGKYELLKTSCVESINCPIESIPSVNLSNSNAKFCKFCQGTLLKEGPFCVQLCTNRGLIVKTGANGSYCTNCDILYELNGECLVYCPEFYSYATLNQNNYCKNCLLEETMNIYIQNGVCVPVCDKQYIYNDLNMTCTLCPFDEFIYENKCYKICPNNTNIFTSPYNYCEDICPGQLIENDQCVNECQILGNYKDLNNICINCGIEYYDYSTFSCSSICLNDINKEFGDSTSIGGGLYCKIKEINNVSNTNNLIEIDCKALHKFTSQSNTCVDFCDEGYEPDINNVCVKAVIICSDLKAYNDLGICVDCPNSLYPLVLDNKCVIDCNKELYEILLNNNNWNECVLKNNYDKETCPEFCNNNGICSIDYSKENLGKLKCDCNANFYGTQCDVKIENFIPLKENFNNQVEILKSNSLENFYTDTEYQKLFEIISEINDFPELYSDDLQNYFNSNIQNEIDKILNGEIEFNEKIFGFFDLLLNINVSGKSNLNKSLIYENLELLSDKFLNESSQELYNLNSTIYLGEKYDIQITSTNKKTIDESRKNNLPIVDYTKCKMALKNSSFIKDNDEIFSIVTSFDSSLSEEKDNNTVSNSKIVKTSTYTSDKKKIDTSDCIVEIKYPLDKQAVDYENYLKLKALGVDIFNPQDEFFNNACFIYNDDKLKIDIPITLRKQIYNQTTNCGNGCVYKGIDIHSYILCECMGPIENKQATFDKSIYNDLVQNNIKLTVCFKEVFNNKILSNRGLYISITLFGCLLIVNLICYFARHSNLLKKTLAKINIKDDAISLKQPNVGLINVNLVKSNNLDKNQINPVLVSQVSYFTNKNELSSNNMSFDKAKVNKKQSRLSSEFFLNSNQKQNDSKFNPSKVGNNYDSNENKEKNKSDKYNQFLYSPDKNARKINDEVEEIKISPDSNAVQVERVKNKKAVFQLLSTQFSNYVQTDKKYSNLSLKQHEFSNLTENTCKNSTNQVFTAYKKSSNSTINPLTTVNDIIEVNSLNGFNEITEINSPQKSKNNKVYELKDDKKIEINEDKYNKLFGINNQEDLPLIKQLELDKRSLCQYFWETTKEEHNFLNLIFYETLLTPMWFRFLQIYLEYSLDVALNAVFYDEDFISKQSKNTMDNIKTNFRFNLLSRFFSFLWPVIISIIIKKSLGCIVKIPKLFINELSNSLKTNCKMQIENAQ